MVFNGQTSNWANIHAGVPQGSILVPLLFLIYIIDLAENLTSNPKLFTDDTSLFSLVHGLSTSANEINYDLKKIEAWAHHWRMSFNPDPLKQVQGVIFSRKRNKTHHPDIVFNGNPVKKVLTKNIWVYFLMVSLILINILKECLIKLINLLVLFASSKICYRDLLFCKSINLVIPHLDYGDLIYDKAFIGSFQKKLESIQYNTALTITEAIRGTTREKIYSELGLE